MTNRFFVFHAIIYVATGFMHGAFSEENTDAEMLVKSLASAESTERDNAERKLRGMGQAAIKALRDTPLEEDAAGRAGNILTDVAIETAKIDPLDAELLHEIARQEGKGRRYTNAERLYRRAEELFDQLKDDADNRRDNIKKNEYNDKRKLCDRMKDKAGHKANGSSHSGIDLGFVRVGRNNDMSDVWE